MKLGRKLMIALSIGIIALLLAGCANTSSQLKSTAAGSSAPATSAAASMAPSAVVSASSKAVPALNKDQLKSMEQPLTGLLLTVEEYGKD
ncbi:MAG: hypothetical protein WCP73_06690, partial [Eubacteriales bacterium]